MSDSKPSCSTPVCVAKADPDVGKWKNNPFSSNVAEYKWGGQIIGNTVLGFSPGNWLAEVVSAARYVTLSDHSYWRRLCWVWLSHWFQPGVWCVSLLWYEFFFSHIPSQLWLMKLLVFYFPQLFSDRNVLRIYIYLLHYIITFLDVFCLLHILAMCT